MPSRDPSKSFSIIKQARPKNSTNIYYMWQNNLRGEQGRKCLSSVSQTSPPNLAGLLMSAGRLLDVESPRSGDRCLPKQPGLGMFHSLKEALWQLFMPWWVLEGHGSLSCASQAAAKKAWDTHPWLEASCPPWALPVGTPGLPQNKLAAQLTTQHMAQMLPCVAAQEQHPQERQLEP